MNERPVRPAGVRAAWLHHAAVLAAIAALGYGGSVLTSLDGGLYFFSPVAAGVSVMVLPLTRTGLRHALAIALVTLGIQIASDLTLPPVRDVQSHVAWFKGGLRPVDMLTPEDVAGIPLLLDHLRSDTPADLGFEPSYTGRTPRLRVAHAIQRVGHLAVPFFLVGVLLGIRSWLADRVTFRRPSDERMAHLTLGWIAAPSALGLYLLLGDRISSATLFSGLPLKAGFVLPLVILLLGGSGWWASARLVRMNEMTSE